MDLIGDSEWKVYDLAAIERETSVYLMIRIHQSDGCWINISQTIVGGHYSVTCVTRNLGRLLHRCRKHVPCTSAKYNHFYTFNGYEIPKCNSDWIIFNEKSLLIYRVITAKADNVLSYALYIYIYIYIFHIVQATIPPGEWTQITDFGISWLYSQSECL